MDNKNQPITPFASPSPNHDTCILRTFLEPFYHRVPPFSPPHPGPSQVENDRNPGLSFLAMLLHRPEAETTLCDSTLSSTACGAEPSASSTSSSAGSWRCRSWFYHMSLRSSSCCCCLPARPV